MKIETSKTTKQQKIESCLYLSFISLLVVYGEFSTSYIQYLKNNTKMYTHSTRLAWRYPDIATIEIVWIDNPTHSLHKKYWMYVHWNVSILHFNFRAMGIENSTTPLLILFFSYFSSPSLSLHSAHVSLLIISNKPHVYSLARTCCCCWKIVYIFWKIRI